ncbi:MAG: DegT/DnrJ/EryC1/StrS family aminotransferase [Thermomicrobiales bacterium]
MSATKLARDGGDKIRTRPFPSVSNATGRTLGIEEIQAVEEVLRSGELNRTIATHSRVKSFENAFCTWLGVDQAVASTSGTSALHLAVAAIDPNPGDEIIVTPITDFGSIIPIIAQNAVPVFADVLPGTWCVDPESIRVNITERTRAIIVVHLFGQPADLDPILEIAAEHRIPVIEDCSQAYGALYKGQKVGTFGALGCFSLQQSKHITSGDGGLTVTNDPHLAYRMRLFSDKGWPREGELRTHLYYGVNYRMTELQGAVGGAQLPKLDGVIAARRRAGHLLESLIGELPGLSLPTLPGGGDSESVYWLFPIDIDTTVLGLSVGEFAAAVRAEGVPASAGYVTPMYLTPALAEGKTYGDSHFPFDSPYTMRSYTDFVAGLCPVAESMAERMLVVPINEKFTDHDVRDIAAAFTKVVQALTASV